MSSTHTAASQVVGPDRLIAWRSLLQSQHGLATLQQMMEFGLTWNGVAAQLAARRWEHVLPRVYSTVTGPLSAPARLTAALLYGGPTAILSHRTAAELWGLLPVQDGPVHLTVPYTCSAVSQPPSVVVHRSRAHRHIAVIADPPRSAIADTAVDVAVAEPDPVAARRMLVALLATGRVAVGAVDQRLEERPARRYRRALAEAVRLVRDGVHSALEELYAVEVERAHGLPDGRRQEPVVVDGVRLYEDVVYDHVGAPLTVRLDGRTHLVDGVAFRDRRRDNAAELAGRSRLVYGWRDLSADPCAAAAEVTTVLRRLGWSGARTTCPRCS